MKLCELNIIPTIFLVSELSKEFLNMGYRSLLLMRQCYNFLLDRKGYLNGSNLLYLLEKHGHKAKIDVEEARRLMKVQGNL